MNELLNTRTGRDIADEIAAKAGVTLSDCYQCGKCSAGCPMSHAMDVMPRQIVRLLQLGRHEDVLRSKTIWLCAACGTCAERCPHSINLPALLENARHEAKRRKLCAAKEIDLFTDIFLENIKRFGKSQEAVLEGAYNVLSGNLTQDMKSVPHMLKHQLIKPEVHTVSGKKSVRELIKAALEEDDRP